MGKFIKEFILFLLVCLVTLLIFAILFYKFIPSQKSVAEVVTYAVPEKIQQLTSDDINASEEQIVVTYEVTSKDLSNYKTNNVYVPGNPDPFAEIEDENTTTGNANSSVKSDNTSNNTNTTTSKDNNTSFEGYIRNNGTK